MRYEMMESLLECSVLIMTDIQIDRLISNTASPIQ